VRDLETLIAYNSAASTMSCEDYSNRFRPRERCPRRPCDSCSRKTLWQTFSSGGSFLGRGTVEYPFYFVDWTLACSPLIPPLSIAAQPIYSMRRVDSSKLGNSTTSTIARLSKNLLRTAKLETKLWMCSTTPYHEETSMMLAAACSTLHLSPSEPYTPP